jgi:putative ABC transport system substrate-binding protein
MTLLGGAAAVWPLAARAQQPGLPVIGFLASGSADIVGPALAAFRQGLMEIGFVEGQNVTIEYRWADEVYDRLPALAADLVHRQVRVIATAGGNLPAIAAKAANSSIPIVFTTGGDPVAAGLVASFNRPGGNLTGASFFSGELGPKRLELLHEVVPAARVVAVLLNPNSTNFENQATNLQAAARSLGLQLHVVRTSTDQDVEALPSTIAQSQIGALLIGPDNFIFSRNERIASLALSTECPRSTSGGNSPLPAA